MSSDRIVKRLDGPVRRIVHRPEDGRAPVVGATVPASEQDESSVGVELPASQPSNIIYTQTAAAPLRKPWWQIGTQLSRKQIFGGASLVLIAIVALVGIKAVMASQRIVTKNTTGGAPVLNGDIDPTKLKGEGDGRINILLLGTGGARHDGPALSDTVMWRASIR